MKLHLSYATSQVTELSPLPGIGGRQKTGTKHCGPFLAHASFEATAGFGVTDAHISALGGDSLFCSLDAKAPAMRLLCLLEGRMMITDALGQPQALGPGCMAFFNGSGLPFWTYLNRTERLHLMILELPVNYLPSLSIREESLLNRTIAATTELLLMAAEIIRCPLEGAKRDLSIQAKLIVFCGSIIGLLFRPPQPGNKITDYATILELLDAREILIKESEKPNPWREILKRAGLDSEKSRHAFKALFGVDISSYLPSIRLTKSFRSVIEGHDSLEAIAIAAAYNSVSNYIAAFRKYGQVTPAALRKHYRQKKGQLSTFFVANRYAYRR